MDSEYLEQTFFARIQESIDYFQQQMLPGVLSQSLEYVKVLASLGGFLVIFVIATVLLAKDYDDIGFWTGRNAMCIWRLSAESFGISLPL